MASHQEVELVISAAKDLKNVNWRHGPIRPYAVVWVDPSRKQSTKADKEGDTCPHWDEKLVVAIPGPVVDEDSTLCIDIVHAGDEEDTKKLIGSARLKLIEVLEEAGLNEPLKRSLTLKRPSGRPHGKLDVKVTIREPQYHHPPPGAYYAPPYGVPQPPPPAAVSRDYYTQQPPPPSGYPYYPNAPPPSGYPYNPYNATAPPPPVTASSYSYGQGQYGNQGSGYYGGDQEKKKSSKFGGMGTGLAVGAVAGALGGLALAEGFDALEDKIADDAADKVEDDIGYDDDDF
ncbi:hypothetical protein EZV62_005973 [Acer yangbiense]|uniref:C2 domain-containing protein n=1 Tax=Acer yangbiense TaxID=1000413 RepID=A0A5C7IPN3_9ROSI|nr:hypothetical protein EZV62_005973 [Acer yangbiense]